MPIDQPEQQPSTTHDAGFTRRRLLFAGLALGLVTPAQARNFGVQGPPDAGQVAALLSTGSLALQTSQVALNRSPNPDVRRFAVSEIAEQQGIARAVTGSARPAPLSRRQAAILAEARSLRGGLAFDQVYVGRQLEGHQQLLALAQTYAAQGADPDVAGIAKGALPLIRRHIAILTRLNGAIG